MVRPKKIIDPYTLKINQSTAKLLRKEGRYGETLDDVIVRLIEGNK